MDEKVLKERVREIVRKAAGLRDRHTDAKGAPVNYACIFSQSRAEYEELLEAAHKIGKVVEEMSTGLLFQIRPLDTVAGDLKLLKIRIPDKTKPEKGDADFTVPDYGGFKRECLPRSGFRLIQREKFEMIELMEPGCDVRAYFSHPPLDEQLGLK